MNGVLSVTLGTVSNKVSLWEGQQRGGGGGGRGGVQCKLSTYGRPYKPHLGSTAFI